MGLPKTKLWATNIRLRSGEILLSAYRPIKKEDGKYYRPPDTPTGYDIWIPNCLGIKYEEGPVRVEIIVSEEETGIWLICVDDYFGDEKHLYSGTNKPTKRREPARYFRDWNTTGLYGTLHVGTKIKMVAGDGPLSIGLKRRSNKRNHVSLL